MKSLSQLVVLALIALLASCQSTGQQSSKTEKEIESFLTDYYATFSSRNWPAFKRFFWENAVMATPWPVDGNESVYIFTIDEFLAQTGEGPDSQPIFEERMIDFEFKSEGKLATVWANYEAKFGTDGDLTEWSGKDVFTLMYHNGKWGIVSLAYVTE